MKKNSLGFTLLEIILVLAIVAIIAAVAIPISQNVLTQNSLDTTAHNLESDLNRAYTYARAGKNDSDWGVVIIQQSVVKKEPSKILQLALQLIKITKARAQGLIEYVNTITFFAGEFDTQNTNGLNETYNIPANITIGGSLFIDGIAEVVFAKGTGIPNIPNSVDTITLTSNQNITKTIYINAQGQINLGMSEEFNPCQDKEIGEACIGTTVLYAGEYNGHHYMTTTNDAGTMEWQTGIDSCQNLNYGEYSDWFLPSKDELNTVLFLQSNCRSGNNMCNDSGQLGGFILSPYWSSTEGDNNNAWVQSFMSGYQNLLSKGPFESIRCVRKY